VRSEFEPLAQANGLVIAKHDAMISDRVAALIACSLLLTASGCDERALIVDPPLDGGAPNEPHDASPSPQVDVRLTEALPAGVVPAPYIAVPRVTGSCSDPDGRPYVPASAGETASLLVGVWQVCSGGGGTLIDGLRDGMELARDRRWRSLVDANGALTPATGFDSEGVWYLSAEDPNDMVVATRWVVRIGTTGAGASGYPVEFLQNPSKIRLGHTITFVWLGE